MRSLATAILGVLLPLLQSGAPQFGEQQAREILARQTVPMEPFRLVGNVYYVGTKLLSAFLIVTPSGNILIDSGIDQAAPLILKNVEKLGFRVEDTKILLSSHAHFDHVAGFRTIRDRTRAQVVVMRQDADEVRSGHSEFSLGWPACPVDRELSDGDTVSLGGVTLTARLTPGHTKGCTTFTLQTTEDGRVHDVVLIGALQINPGVRLLDTPEYPTMAEDWARTFEVLKALPCSVFAGWPEVFEMERKLAQRRPGGQNPFVDPEGYRAKVQEAERVYLSRLSAERR